MGGDLGGRRGIKKKRMPTDGFPPVIGDMGMNEVIARKHGGGAGFVTGVHRKSVDLVVLFFSSRRRHTRLQGDWSSDVCSSDLLRREFDVLPPGDIRNCM